jgi:hypothetical protein
MVCLRNLMLLLLFDSIGCEGVFLCHRKVVFIVIIFLFELRKVVQVEDIDSILELVMLFQEIV